MEHDKIQQLIDGFNANRLTSAEQSQLEQLISDGEIEPTRLSGIAELDHQLSKMQFPEPSDMLNDRFYHMLALQKKSAHGAGWSQFFSWFQLQPKLALASITLLTGLFIGYLLRPASNATELQALSQQVTDLKQMMMLSLLEKESATERLKAVSLTQEMPTISKQVTDALIKTLNNDENVNVRLAALDALRPYLNDGTVREQVVRSITRQTSPLVQLAMADLMAQMQVKSSVDELKKIVQSDNTPLEVKKRIQENIKVLI